MIFYLWSRGSKKTHFLFAKGHLKQKRKEDHRGPPSLTSAAKVHIINGFAKFIRVKNRIFSVH